MRAGTLELFIFCKGDENNELPREMTPDASDLSPVLFDDSPSSSPCCEDASRAFEIFGTSVEEAVREMRFRIEQKTLLTASAGEGNPTEKKIVFLSLHYEYDDRKVVYAKQCKNVPHISRNCS